jgi:hypothetical protein
MIHTEVVCNPQSPWEEFALICVAARTKGINDFDEYFLENIFSQAPILYQDDDGSENSVFVLFDQLFQRIGIAVNKKCNQLLVSKVDRIFHGMVLYAWIWFHDTFYRYHGLKLKLSDCHQNFG